MRGAAAKLTGLRGFSFSDLTRSSFVVSFAVWGAQC